MTGNCYRIALKFQIHISNIWTLKACFGDFDCEICLKQINYQQKKKKKTLELVSEIRYKINIFHSQEQKQGREKDT